MKKIIGNCTITGNNQPIDVLSFYDLTDKQQADILDYTERGFTDEMQFIICNGQACELETFQNASFGDFKKWVAEKNEPYRDDSIILYETAGMYVIGAYVSWDYLETVYHYNFKWEVY